MIRFFQPNWKQFYIIIILFYYLDRKKNRKIKFFIGRRNIAVGKIKFLKNSFFLNGNVLMAWQKKCGFSNLVLSISDERTAELTAIIATAAAAVPAKYIYMSQAECRSVRRNGLK